MSLCCASVRWWPAHARPVSLSSAPSQHTHTGTPRAGAPSNKCPEHTKPPGAVPSLRAEPRVRQNQVGMYTAPPPLSLYEQYRHTCRTTIRGCTHSSTVITVSRHWPFLSMRARDRERELTSGQFSLSLFRRLTSSYIHREREREMRGGYTPDATSCMYVSKCMCVCSEMPY